MRLSIIAENLTQFLSPQTVAHQFGDCGPEIYQITKKAVANRILDFKVIEGMVEVAGDVCPHYWIEYRGKILDPTKSQFPEEPLYSPPGEYREEWDPVEFLDDWHRQYGE
jgi:hypothetical protein